MSTTTTTDPTTAADLIDALRELNAYELSHRADCAGPDSRESEGAQFLAGVRDHVIETIEYTDDVDDIDVHDAAHDAANAAPSVYTTTRWAQFVDLAAYTEDIDDYGPADDMTAAAGVALYVIAERLAVDLLQTYLDDAADIVEPSPEGPHVHAWGPWERSTIAGTSHRKCTTLGCDDVTLDGDDEPDDDDDDDDDDPTPTTPGDYFTHTDGVPIVGYTASGTAVHVLALSPHTRTADDVPAFRMGNAVDVDGVGGPFLAPFGTAEAARIDAALNEPSVLTFDAAMATVCPACGFKACVHRLTTSGRLYCAYPGATNPYGKSRGGEWRTPTHDYTCPVRELSRSPLPDDVGATIRAGLTTYA